MRLLLASLVLVVACSDYTLTGPEDTETPTSADGEPVSDAGPDRVVAPLTTVTLDGSASYDPGGEGIAAFAWTLVSRPPDSTATLQDADRPFPTFWADVAGPYTVELVVENGAGVWDTSPDRAVIDARPDARFYVQLVWDQDVDLDLHLLDGDSELYRRPGDCTHCNKHPDWGVAGLVDDDPSLDWDSGRGGEPETVTIQDPAAGEYRIRVHYFGRNGDAYCGSQGAACPTTNATVRLFIDGAEAGSWTRAMTRSGDVWHVASVQWPALTATTEDTVTRTTALWCTGP